jgi:hypothetical protein
MLLIHLHMFVEKITLHHWTQTNVATELMYVASVLVLKETRT